MTMNDIEYRQLKDRTVYLLKALHSKTSVQNFIDKYGYSNLFHRRFLWTYKPVFRPSKHTHGMVQVIKPIYKYSFSMPSNLYLSYYHMKDVRQKSWRAVRSWLVYTVRTHRILYKPIHINFYNIQITAKDSRLSTDYIKSMNTALASSWKDKSNHKDTYSELSQLNTYLNQQINNNKGLSSITPLASSIECPWHVQQDITPSQAESKNIYGHCHIHKIIAVTDDRQLQILKSTLSKDYLKIMKYKPFKSTNIKPLSTTDGSKAVITYDITRNHRSMLALHRFMNYILTDYHLQTKDCSFRIFKRLPKGVQSDLISCQLCSTKGKRIDKRVSKTNVGKVRSKYQQAVKWQHKWLSTKVNHSVSILSDRDVASTKSANGRYLTKHHTSQKEAISRFYGKGYYSIEYGNTNAHIVQMSLLSPSHVLVTE